MAAKSHRNHSSRTTKSAKTFASSYSLAVMQRFFQQRSVGDVDLARMSDLMRQSYKDI
jgi:hypothetical protein